MILLTFFFPKRKNTFGHVWTLIALLLRVVQDTAKKSFGDGGVLGASLCSGEAPEEEVRKPWGPPRIPEAQERQECEEPEQHTVQAP